MFNGLLHFKPVPLVWASTVFSFPLRATIFQYLYSVFTLRTRTIKMSQPNINTPNSDLVSSLSQSQSYLSPNFLVFLPGLTSSVRLCGVERCPAQQSEEEEEEEDVNSSHKSYFIDLFARWLPVNDSVVDVLSIRQVATLLYNVTINIVTICTKGVLGMQISKIAGNATAFQMLPPKIGN